MYICIYIYMYIYIDKYIATNCGYCQVSLECHEVLAARLAQTR